MTAAPGPREGAPVEEQIRELTRGVVELHDVGDLRERIRAGHRLRVKAGFDPTRPDLHLGHTVLMRKMRQFQDFGHQVVFLIGDFTAMVGDPTGQNEARPRLTREAVLAAAETYQEQAFKILDRDRTEVRYNSEWLGAMTLDRVIELAAKRTVARTLERRDFRERFEAQRDIYLHELFYPMLQGYDSVALEADVELGGSDQLFNLMVGRDLMGRHGHKPQIVMTTPILEGTDARFEGGLIVGRKMSKSADNYVGLNEPPLHIYRKCMQIGDDVIWRFFELLSARSVEDIEALKASGPMAAKAAFAGEMVERFHGADAAAGARNEFAAAYLASGVPDDTPELDLEADGEGLWLARALAGAGLVKSTSEGRRLTKQGGVQVDGERVDDEQHRLAVGGRFLLRVGSKNRRFCYVTVK